MAKWHRGLPDTGVYGRRALRAPWRKGTVPYGSRGLRGHCFKGHRALSAPCPKGTARSKGSDP